MTTKTRNWSKMFHLEWKDIWRRCSVKCSTPTSSRWCSWTQTVWPMWPRWIVWTSAVCLSLSETRKVWFPMAKAKLKTMKSPSITPSKVWKRTWFACLGPNSRPHQLACKVAITISTLKFGRKTRQLIGDRPSHGKCSRKLASTIVVSCRSRERGTLTRSYTPILRQLHRLCPWSSSKQRRGKDCTWVRPTTVDSRDSRKDIRLLFIERVFSERKPNEKHTHTYTFIHLYVQYATNNYLI